MKPLFLAVVDKVDSSAVLDLISVMPTADGKHLRAFHRKDGSWAEDPALLRQLRSVNPPPVVELDAETLSKVVEQMDSYDKKKAAQKAKEKGPAA